MTERGEAPDLAPANPYAPPVEETVGPPVEETVGPPVVTGWRRALYIALGVFFLILAALGGLLPVMPGTPFLILASYFFMRSVPWFHDWLLQSPWFGPLLRDWYKRGGVRPHIKILALTMMPAAAVVSAWLLSFNPYVVAALIVLCTIGVYVVARLPTARD
ncbi:MAG: YbaN family protein [Planctomycetia bacterium]